MHTVQKTVIERLCQKGLMDEALYLTRSPTELAQHSGSGPYMGLIQHQSAAFTRPANRIGCYPACIWPQAQLPGGGMPHAMLSGKAAAEAIQQDCSA